MEPGQDWKVAALTFIFMCTFFIGDNMNDIDYMKLALKEAQKAFKHGEIPVGAIIVKNGKVIAKGYNKCEKKYSSTRHAEIITIEKAGRKLKNWRLIDCTMYVTMLPCPMCASAINQARIKRIVYGTIPKYVNYEDVVNTLNDKKYGLPVEIGESILADESIKLLKTFFKKKRN